MPLTQAYLGSLASSSTGSAFGNFVYSLMERKERTSTLVVKLAKDSSSGFVVGIMITNIPYVGIALASVLGVYSIKNVFSNKLIKNSERVKAVAEALTKNGACLGMAFGGGVVGQMIIPVPFLGAFIGSAIGGFASSAFIGIYDKIKTTQVSFESLTLYCLLMIARGSGKWEKFPDEQEFNSEKDTEIVEKFFGVCTYVSNTDMPTLAKDLKKKRKVMRELIESVFIETATNEVKDMKDQELAK